MLKAGSLLYSVFLSIILMLISGSFILWAFYQNRYLDDILIKERLISNISSAFNMLLEKWDVIKDKNETTLNLYNDPENGIKISKKEWGFYEIVICEEEKNGFSYSKKALIGDNIFSGDPIALYLCNQDDYLYVCGKTLLKGTCWLPKKGIKRAYIEGNSFAGTKFVEGEIKQSNNSLPELNKNIVNYNIAIMEKAPGEQDSLIWYEAFEKKDTIQNNFNQKTLYIYSNQKINLENKVISGNIIFKSEKGIEIEPSAKIHDAILYTPYLIIKDNFDGTLQAFVSDSVVIGKECHLWYPSVIALLNKKEIKNLPTISIGEKTELSGALVLYNEQKKQTDKAILKINKDAIINGQVYCNSYVDLKGSIYGSLYCNRFILVTPSSTYENHLLNATIDFEGLSKFYTGVSLLESTNKKEIIRWLQ